MMTREHLRTEMLDLVPELIGICPPAAVFDKVAYSQWVDGRLHAYLHSRHRHDRLGGGRD